jgi:prepilin-type N-terminal cleavage/methylation domain-containing protein
LLQLKSVTVREESRKEPENTAHLGVSMPSNSSAFGFTLLELMIVIGVIAILTALALPQFAAYRKTSYSAAAMSDLGNTKTVLQAYFSDHQYYPH